MRSGLLAPLLLALACNEAPSDRREWKASDHDHTDGPSANQVVGGPDAGAPELARVGLDEVSIVAWQQNCVRCHGKLGRGDGPQGPMTRAIDLGNPDFQRTITDDQILKSLKEGKGLMPASPLPEPTLKALVRLVRLIGKANVETSAAEGAAAGDPSPHGSAAPNGSARPMSSARAPGSATRPVLAPTARTAGSAPATGTPAPAVPPAAP